MRCLSLFSALPVAVLAYPKGPVPGGDLVPPRSIVIPGNSFNDFDTYWKWVVSGLGDRSAGLTIS